MTTIFEELLRERDHWRDRALDAEQILVEKLPKKHRKRVHKRQGRRILRLVSINGKTPHQQ